MSSWRSILFPTAAFVAALASPAAALPASDTTPAAFRAGEVLVRFHDGAAKPECDALLASIGSARARQLGRTGLVLARLAGTTTEAAIARLAGHPLVEYAEPNWIVAAMAVPNDPRFPEQWALQNTGQTGGTPGADIDAVPAWDLETGSADVLVAVIDTGLDFAHPDLAPNAWTNPGEVPANGIDDDGNGYVDDVHGWDFVNDDGDPTDDNGHGSFVAGPIGAAGDNGIGIAGVCWHLAILPIKTLTSFGSGTTADQILGIEYAIAAGARVLNASWGGGGYSQALHDAIEHAQLEGIAFVAVAGASGTNIDVSPMYPASYALDNVVAVAATDHNDALASFSNWGPNTVDLAAPGVNILTTGVGGGYTIISGTSNSAAFVSGALGLLFARFPSFPGQRAIDHLLAHVDVLPGLAGKVRTSGRLNAWAPLFDAPTSAPGPPGEGGLRLRLRCEPGSGGSVQLAFEVAAAGDAALDLFDLRGRRVRALVHAALGAGAHRATWDGTDDAGRRVARGVYVARLRHAGSSVRTRVPWLRGQGR